MITAVPLFFAGLLFSQIFKYRKEPTLSLVYNLMGAICGGLFEYSSMFFGTKYLSILALLYTFLLFWFTDVKKVPANASKTYIHFYFNNNLPSSIGLLAGIGQW